MTYWARLSTFEVRRMDLQEYQHRKTLTHHEHEKLSRFRKHMQKQMARKLAQIDRELVKPVAD